MVLSWRVPKNLKMLEDPDVVCHWCAYPDDFDIIHDECLDRVQEASWELDNEECVFFCKRVVGNRVTCYTEEM